jgi:hypothetical protein
VVGQGFKCSTIPRESDDWAVLKLERPVTGVKPYRLPAPNERLEKEDRIVSVNAYNEDVHTTDKGARRKWFPKTIEDCTNEVNHYDLVEILYFQSTCYR